MHQRIEKVELAILKNFKKYWETFDFQDLMKKIGFKNWSWFNFQASDRLLENRKTTESFQEETYCQLKFSKYYYIIDYYIIDYYIIDYYIIDYSLLIAIINYTNEIPLEKKNTVQWVVPYNGPCRKISVQ